MTEFHGLNWHDRLECGHAKKRRDRTLALALETEAQDVAREESTLHTIVDDHERIAEAHGALEHLHIRRQATNTHHIPSDIYLK